MIENMGAGTEAAMRLCLKYQGAVALALMVADTTVEGGSIILLLDATDAQGERIAKALRDEKVVPLEPGASIWVLPLPSKIVLPILDALDVELLPTRQCPSEALAGETRGIPIVCAAGGSLTVVRAVREQELRRWTPGDGLLN